MYSDMCVYFSLSVFTFYFIKSMAAGVELRLQKGAWHQSSMVEQKTHMMHNMAIIIDILDCYLIPG